MSTLQKKKIKAVELKKTSTISRLIKCYVCNQHFDSQPQFDLHLKQHQSKLNRTNIEEIQRKTQESFNKKKQPDSLNKTQSIALRAIDKQDIEKSKENRVPDIQDLSEEKEEEEIEAALRESQILLERIEFMTQVIPSEQPLQPKTEQQEQVQSLEKTIEGERQLHRLITKAQNNANIQKLILQTHFEMQSFQNYQNQLEHLRVLASAAVNPDSVGKILSIRKSICRDISTQLQAMFSQEKTKQKAPLKKIETPEIRQNTGEVRFCADCLSDIGGSEELYSLPCGHFYHVDCWNGYCCG